MRKIINKKLWGKKINATRHETLVSE